MPEDRDQKDVLPKKDNVTKSSIGLQQWGDEGTPDEATHGDRERGTAGRQGSIARGQGRQADEDAKE